MEFRRILITGGAGFVGANLATQFRRHFERVEVTAMDNLKRRGSELNLPRLREHGVRFVHGDVRAVEDFEALPPFDVLLDCAAEPSVQAGADGSPRYVLNSNLQGTINSLEACRRRDAAILLLSTSRVYPIRPLNDIPFDEDETRFRWQRSPGQLGVSSEGIAEEFPLAGARSLYGASKLSSELLLQEYVHQYDLRGLIDRCGVLAGPWQMGKVDQGVVTLWVARHYFQQPLRYLGFGGRGKQVRDALHVDDLFDLLVRQMHRPDLWDGGVYNAGGGCQQSISLHELSDLCRDATGHRVPISSCPQTNPLDVRLFVTDSRKAQEQFDWRPRRSAETIVTDIRNWIDERRTEVQAILG